MGQIDSNNYVENVLRTESVDFEAIRNRMSAGVIRLLHASEGMQTESAEFTDMLKKHLFYGKPFNKANAIEELGDLLWYVAVACDELDINLNEIMALNIDKLAKRYPEKFTEADAINRNVEKEMENITARVGSDIIRDYDLVQDYVVAIVNDLCSTKDTTPESLFADDLGADSLDVAEIALNVEQRFGISISDEIAADFKQVKDLIDFVAKY